MFFQFKDESSARKLYVLCLLSTEETSAGRICFFDVTSRVSSQNAEIFAQ